MRVLQAFDCAGPHMSIWKAILIGQLVVKYTCGRHYDRSFIPGFYRSSMGIVCDSRFNARLGLVVLHSLTLERLGSGSWTRSAKVAEGSRANGFDLTKGIAF